MSTLVLITMHGLLCDMEWFHYISFIHSCWLSSGDGTYAIWTFVAPMLAIIVVSVKSVILLTGFHPVGGKGGTLKLTPQTNADLANHQFMVEKQAHTVATQL